MAEEDFDIDSLAAYLHLTPSQVSKMAERERLPGRRIGGHWRFARAEIHNWLEDQIGASNETLSEVEQVLERSHSQVSAPNVLDLLPIEAIAVPLAAKTRESVIRGMIELATDTGLLWDPDKMLEAVRAREGLHSTAMENGVALLHSRRPLPNILAEPFIALGRTSSGIPFGGSRGILTDVFFLILSTDESGHLRLLARLSRLIMLPDVLENLRTADSAAESRHIIADAEEALDS
jgi:nitrogen PTS system EIIA component